MKRLVTLTLLLSLVTVALSGCYVVPAPPPPASGASPLPSLPVVMRPDCAWKYGVGWYGWGWYGFC